MSGLLNRIFKRDASSDDGAISYKEAKVLAGNVDVDVRAQLAARDDVVPEILYFLAEDESPAVRRAIAANARSPRHADRLLAEDADDEVRCDLAYKIGRLVPQLSDEEKDQLQKLTLEILDILAHDQLPRVRQIVAEEIKSCDSVPRHVIRTLAHDIELIVAAPVLEFSPLLSDEDLLEIIDSDSVKGALSVISRRTHVSATVADAIAASDDADAVTALLANSSAQIREETLDDIVERAPKREAWHRPLVERPDLSVRAIRRVASFVALKLLRVLDERRDLPPEAVDDVRQAVAKRIRESGVDGDIAAPLDAEKLHTAGDLDENCISEAIERGDRDFIVKALSLKADITSDAARKVLASQSAKSVTALSWAAGLSMRLAIQIQLRVAKIAPTAVLNARDGVDYPLTESELQWHVDLFGQ